MKKHIVFFLIISCINSLNAQWQIQNSGTDLNLTSAFFIDNETGWVVGNEGIILHTIDGGDTWTEQISGTDFDLKSVHFINPDTGWIAGGQEDIPQSSIILRTVNGGETWEQMNINSSSSFCLNDIYFSNGLNGWAVGQGHFFTSIWGTLLQSIDGGETWVEKDSIPPFSWPPSLPLRDIYFINSDIGWVAGGWVTPSSGYSYCFVMKTNNGGNTWEEQFNHGTSPWGPIIYPPINHIYFTDNNMGWAVGRDLWLPGSGSILHTFDGGITWESQYIYENTSLLDIQFTDTVTGWVVGSNGTILYTVNGGENWNFCYTGVSDVLQSVYFHDQDNGWVVGENGTILHTTNGGVGISKYSSPENNSIMIISFPNPFTISTTLSYTLDKPEDVHFTVYNVRSQIVFWMQEKQVAGEQRIEWNAEGLPAGMYYYRLQAGSYVGSGKMIKMK